MQPSPASSKRVTPCPELGGTRSGPSRWLPPWCFWIAVPTPRTFSTTSKSRKTERTVREEGSPKGPPCNPQSAWPEKYYEKCHQLLELVNDTTKKQRVEDWDQLLFVKKDDTLEQQNQRNDLIPDDKKMIDDDEKDGGLDFLNSLLAGSQVEDLYNEANAAGQDHRGYQSFTPNWNTKDPNPMPVDGKNPFGGVGGSTFDGHDKYQVMSL